ncbi:OmpA family protein [Aliagarivorans taiwanensis]|uniref:OmpA family protein n=1 Tax=Aliagarivorans taiwanensis TaxID=561966 RepID=UPI000404C2C4|nr:OmpA family protein [Aliagarivorans taiwanensis]
MSEQQLTATVYFDLDKAKLSKASRQVLAQLSPEDFSEVIAVEGHTCSLGSDSYNLALAARRAEGVRDAMQHEAFFDRRFVVKSYGKSMPIADNASEHGRALNRRVEIRSQR